MKSTLMLILLLFNGFAMPDNVITRFKIPEGYHQCTAKPGSFAAFLQNLPLKPAGTQTKTYTGDVARTDIYTAAVVDMSVGNQDLRNVQMQ